MVGISGAAGERLVPVTASDFNLSRVNSPPLAAHRFAVSFGFDTPSLAAGFFINGKRIIDSNTHPVKIFAAFHTYCRVRIYRAVCAEYA